MHAAQPHALAAAKGSVMSQRTNKSSSRQEGDAAAAGPGQFTASLNADLERWMLRAEDYAKHDPTKAMVSAFGAGLLLHMLPLGKIAAATTGIAFSMVRPAMLFLGLRKACDLCLNQTQHPTPAEQP